MTDSESEGSLVLAVDCMGGDHGPQVTLPAIEAFLRRRSGVSVLAVGQPEALEAEVARLRRRFGGRIELAPASQVVGMDEAPTSAMRNKKDSSLRVAIEQIKAGRAQAASRRASTGR